MENWKEMLPGRIFPIQYEDLVADTEKCTRGLLQHCELAYEPECLSFHDTRRSVGTFSLEQVRQPVYASSIDRWKNYESELQPLLDELEKSAGR
jgi:hypothetical protein